MTDNNKAETSITTTNPFSKINVVVESDNNKSNAKKISQTKLANNTKPKQEEFGGRGGLEPTRFGDWEKNGRCIDF